MEWYGVPLTNFLGWYVVSLVIVVLSSLAIKSRVLNAVDPYLIISYFLLVAIIIPPVLLVPFIVGIILAGALSIILYLFARRVNSSIRQ